MFHTKAAKIAPADPKDDPNARMVARFVGSIGVQNNYRDAVELAKASVHPMVFRCLDKIASSLMAVEWYAVPDEDVPEAQRASPAECKAMNKLLRRPTPEMTGATLRYWMGLCFAGSGRVPLQVGVAKGEQMPNAFWPMNPAHFKANRVNGVLIGYTYGPGSDEQKFPTRLKASKGTKGYPDQAFGLQVELPNFTGNFMENGSKPTTPLQAIGMPAEIVSMLLQRAWDTASGQPNVRYIVALDKNISEPQQENVKKHLNGESVPGQEESGRAMVVTGAKVDVTTIDNDMSDIHSKMPMNDMGAMIAGAFGIPVALVGLGAADAAKFANNFMESRASFYEDTMIPRYFVPIADAMSDAVPYGMCIKFDLDKIPALQDKRATRAKDLETVTYIDGNEKRALIGFEPTTNPELIKNKPKTAATPAAGAENKTDA